MYYLPLEQQGTTSASQHCSSISVVDCQCHMLLLLWHSGSTLLTCHIAVVFCFCSSLHQGLTSAFLSVAVALWTVVGIVASQTSSHHWQWFIIFQLFCLLILFDSDLIFCMYFYMEGSFSRKEHSMVCESLSSPTTPASLIPDKLVCALSSSNFPCTQESSFPFYQSSLHPLWIHMPLWP